MHRHTSDQILIITEGTGVVATPDEEKTVSAGDVVLIPANEDHWHGAPGDDADGPHHDPGEGQHHHPDRAVIGPARAPPCGRNEVRPYWTMSGVVGAL